MFVINSEIVKERRFPKNYNDELLTIKGTSANIPNENDCVFSKEQVKVTKKDLLIKMYNDFKTIDPNIIEFICDLKYVVKDFYPFSSKYNCDTTPSKMSPSFTRKE